MLRSTWMLILCLTFAQVHISLTEEEEYDGGESDDGVEMEPDDCTFYDTDTKCHHDKFRKASTLQQKFGPNVKECCNGHSYKFYDHCKDNTETEGKLVCGAPGVKPSLPRDSVECPENCTRQKLHENQFEFRNGRLNLENFTEGVKIVDYCTYYECLELPNIRNLEGWFPMAEVCLCFDLALIEKESSDIPDHFQKCCQHTNFFRHEPAGRQEGSEIPDHFTCPYENETLSRLTSSSINDTSLNDQRFRSCHTKFEDFDYLTRVSGNDTIFHIRAADGPKNRTLRTDSDGYCMGVTFSKPFNLKKPLSSTLLRCKDPPCQGNATCLRTCCAPGEIFENATCRTATEDEKKDILKLEHFRQHGLYDYELAKAPAFERLCNKLQERKPYMDPSIRCRDNFTLEKNISFSLKVTYNGRIYHQNEFCISVTKDLQIQPEICRDLPTNQKFKFYPYILILSSLCLFATLVIYTVFPKLLNHYTRIMRHFTISMMLAFIILSINQITPVGNYSMRLCKFFGFAEQYLFLVTFTLMTSMSTEIQMQMSGKPTTATRYRIQVVCGYLFPLIVTLMTLVTEMTADRCAAYKPRFGEEHCFFLEKTAKGIWFFLPIGLMLFINASMFAATISALCKLDREKRRLNLRSPSNRSENMEKFLMYLKLFLGMGFIWSFEIIAGLASDEIHESTWYVTDVINMLQGVYVFVIFVCKRNVINVILGIKRGGMSSKTGGKVGKGGMALRNMGGQNDKELESMSTQHTNATHTTD